MALKDRFKRISGGDRARPLPFKPLTEGPEGSTRFLHVSPERIERDPDQPRKDLGDLEGLRASIKSEGILQPLIVAPLDEIRFRLVAGERRLTAARQLGLGEVPILVRGVEEQQRLVLQIVENLHRKDLSPLEEADGVNRLMEESGLSQREVAARLGKSLTYVNELLRILDLPTEVLEGVRTSEHPITKSVLLEIAKEPDLIRQQTLLRGMQGGGRLTVQLARENKRAAQRFPAAPTNQDSDSVTAAEAGSRAHASSGPATWSVKTSVGTVSVQLYSTELLANPDEVNRALREALEATGKKARTRNTSRPRPR